MKLYLARIVLSFCTLCFGMISFNAHANTMIDSNIIQDTVWSKSNSPYIIEKEIDIYPNVKLKIEPGVKIKFKKNADLEVYGTLQAKGEKNENIVFTSNQENPSRGDWNGIIFKSEAGPT